MPKAMSIKIFSQIFTYDDLDEDQADCWMMSDVVFLKDFGPWIEGDLVPCLTINFLDGTIIENDAEDGSELNKINIRIVPNERQ